MTPDAVLQALLSNPRRWAAELALIADIDAMRAARVAALSTALGIPLPAEQPDPFLPSPADLACADCGHDPGDWEEADPQPVEETAAASPEPRPAPEVLAGEEWVSVVEASTRLGTTYQALATWLRHNPDVRRQKGQRRRDPVMVPWEEVRAYSRPTVHPVAVRQPAEPPAPESPVAPEPVADGDGWTEAILSHERRIRTQALLLDQWRRGNRSGFVMRIAAAAACARRGTAGDVVLLRRDGENVQADNSASSLLPIVAALAWREDRREWWGPDIHADQPATCCWVRPQSGASEPPIPSTTGARAKLAGAGR